MPAILRKELRLSFCSLSTYILLSLFLLSFGILCVIFNLFLGYSSLSYPLGYMTLFLAILTPFLVFFSSKREHGSGMERFLYSLPLSPFSLVFGSFLGQLAVLLIPSLLFSLLPPVFSVMGADQIALSEVALLGYFLFGVFLLSLNRFLFSTLKRPVLSMILAILLNLLIYFFNYLYFYIPLDGIFDTFLSLFNPTGIYYSFTYGRFNLYGVIYFVTLTAFFLFCEILVHKRGRGDFSNKKRGVRAVCVLCAVLLVLLICLPLCSLLPERVSSFDVTGNDIFRISNATVDTLRSVDSPIEIYLLCAGGKKAADKDYLSFLKGYDEGSELISLTVIDTERDPSFATGYTSRKLSDQSLIVCGNGRYRVLDRADLYHYENARLGAVSSADYEYLLQCYMAYMQTGSTEGLFEPLVSRGYQLYVNVNSTIAYFDGDSALCNAIRFVNEKHVSTAYVAAEDGFTSPDELLLSRLAENGFFTKELSSLERIPDDCDALILFSPCKDITQSQRSAISAYLSAGGNLFLTTDYTKTDLPILLSLLSEYGLSASDTPLVICESNQSTYVDERYPYHFFTKISSVPATGNDFSGTYASIFSHPITLTDTEGVAHTKWLTSGNNGYLVTEGGERIEEGSYCCGAIAQKNDSKILWVSSPLSVSSMGSLLSDGGNVALTVSALRWMSDSSFEILPIESAAISSSVFYIPDEHLPIWVILIAIVLPLIPVSIGVIRTYVRKKR